MIPWTAQEISLLIGLWPNASAAQISKQLSRSRASVCGKAMRLRSDDLLPADVEKHFAVNPAVQKRPGRALTTVTTITPAKPTPPVDATVPPPEMRRCSLIELDDGQCRWPLGTVAEVATLFCGGAVEPGRAYCGHHWRIGVRLTSAAIRSMPLTLVQRTRAISSSHRSARLPMSKRPLHR
jgi:hypothetical protein